MYYNILIFTVCDIRMHKISYMWDMSSSYYECRRHRRTAIRNSQKPTEPGPTTVTEAKAEIVDGNNNSHHNSGTGSTSESLKRVRRALVRMRVSALRSIKSLTRDRVPASHRKSVETRYANLLRRVALTTTAVEEAATMIVDSSLLSSTAIPTMAVLLADVYHLEKELIDADEERDRLSSGGDSRCETTSSCSSLQKRFARWFTRTTNDRWWKHRVQHKYMCVFI